MKRKNKIGPRFYWCDFCHKKKEIKKGVVVSANPPYVECPECFDKIKKLSYTNVTED